MILPQNAREKMAFSIAGPSPQTEKRITLECSDLRGCSKSPVRKPDSKDDIMIGSIKERNHSAPGLPGPQRTACTVAKGSGHQFQKGRLEVRIGSPHRNTCACMDTVHLNILMSSTTDNRGFCTHMLQAVVDPTASASWYFNLIESIS